MNDTFVMKRPELGKQVRVRPIGHNREVYDWFVSNLPIVALQGHETVCGYALAAQNVGFSLSLPWREQDLVQETMAAMPEGQVSLTSAVGKAGSVGVKWGAMTAPLPVATWAAVVPEDLPVLAEVGKKVWGILMSVSRPIVHVEFVKEG
jgi:hypothetical protein